jgi:catechol 2,3-dioxygenase-like lactoylglutathione lyase family enzyme
MDCADHFDCADINASAAFYRAFLVHLGLTQVVDRDDYLYFVGGRTAVGLRPAALERRSSCSSDVDCTTFAFMHARART